MEDTSDEFEDVEEDYVQEPKLRSFGWVLPTLAQLAIAGWTGFYAWAYQQEILAGGPPQQWIEWITAWILPVLLIVSLWLLATRNSTREAQRFGQVAQSLAEESARLEARLVTVNRELSLAREFLTTQTRELEFLGRSASERLSDHADRLQELVRDNGSQIDAIASVSGTALENMDRLRDNLPVIANSAKDVSNQIGGAGRMAKAQLDELVAGFKRLNDFGAASERQVASLRERVDDALTAFGEQADQLGTVTEQRFAALRENSDSFRADLDSREIDALAAIRARAETLRAELAEAGQIAAAEHDAAVDSLQQRLEALRSDAASISGTVREGEEAALAAWTNQVEAMRKRLEEAIEEIREIDESALAAANSKLKALFEEAEAVDARIAERNRTFDTETVQRRVEFEVAEQAALALMRERLSELDAALDERRAAHQERTAALVREGEALDARIAALGQAFASAESQGREASQAIAQGVDELSGKLVETREALDGTDMAVSALTDASVRLLELIQASAKQSRETLPEAMQASESRLAQIESRAAAVHSLLDQAREAGEEAAKAMETADNRTRSVMAEVDSFQARFGETATAQVEAIERLRSSVAALGSENESVAAKAQNELRAAIAALETNARAALSAIENEQSERISRIAAKVGEQSTEAIDRALATHTEQALAKLDEATARSSEAGREITRQLRDQLAKVNELTGNLESRIAQARARAMEDVDNDFSRRVALITESLNSNAIDIAKALSTEVTDTAWASYLRGDRGIFTRRAVRLLDNTEAREIAELYDTDRDFREHVSRYIHDFESMLRTMLSTRDGHAVSVTLLSGDMGKLYVVLAQALERLRQ
ncbi:coiled-coil domain-containing protein [Erythrobacter mangrovi]|uniref:ATPase n=1 Tax=Erythrobacter mangrovi TaxID=2739433 RepID=A0A7D3XSA4_9SPHN|nr:ATPase [Erythrobacter mangrovi]QKG71651.1 ATPase [Erythrobacter mangrovi]